MCWLVKGPEPIKKCTLILKKPSFYQVLCHTTTPSFREQTFPSASLQSSRMMLNDLTEKVLGKLESYHESLKCPRCHWPSAVHSLLRYTWNICRRLRWSSTVLEFFAFWHFYYDSSTSLILYHIVGPEWPLNVEKWTGFDSIFVQELIEFILLNRLQKIPHA